MTLIGGPTTRGMVRTTTGEDGKLYIDFLEQPFAKLFRSVHN